MNETMDKSGVVQVEERSQQPDTASDRRPDHITNEVFDRKLNFCPAVFGQWLQPFLDLSKSAILDFGCGDGPMAFGIALRLKARDVIVVAGVPDCTILPRSRRESVYV